MSNFHIKSTEESVELWSTNRLPFEPKGWLLEMRNSLRTALGELQNKKDFVLQAIYSSSEKDFFDVENVLFYNIGSGPFSHLCKNGLIFEHRFTTPPKIRPSNNNRFQHYHRYCASDDFETSFWKKQKSIANWNEVKCPRLKGEIKADNIWYEMKKGDVNITNRFPSTYLGINVRIKAPINTRVNSAGVVKALLDGIISAFHAQTDTKLNELTRYLAIRMKKNENDLKEKLLDTTFAVLGKRELLRRHGKTVQWNPADDNLVYGNLQIEYSNENDYWSHSGEIYIVNE